MSARRAPRVPLPTRVYEALRDDIVEGRREPDSQLVQEQIAEQLGVSRTPVREALTRLTHEGLATWVPGQGYLVADLTDADVTSIFEVRESLEVTALRLAVGRHDKASLRRLEALVEDMAATDPTDAIRHFDLNRAFHSAVVAPCGNPLLLTMLDNLWDLPVNRMITRSYLQRGGRIETMLAEHRQIVAALAAESVERLVEVAVAHLSTGYADAMPDTGGKR